MDTDAHRSAGPQEFAVRGAAEVDAILRKRARTFAAPLAEARTRGDTLSLLVFWVAGERYGLETSDVFEVIPADDLTPLPLAPHFVAGLVYRRGLLLPVFDLPRLLGMEGLRVAKARAVVAVQVREMSFGFLADTVAGTTEAAAEELATPPAAPDGRRPPFLRGVTADLITVVDGDALARDPRIIVNEEVR